MKPQNKLKIFLLTSGIVLLIVIVIGILGANGLFHTNPFGESTNIDNFSSYFRNVPNEKRDAVFSALYGTIANNLDDNTPTPTSGAIIRKNSVNTEYIEASLSNFSTFIVDIESIQQSYDIQMSWSNNPDTTIAGYEILITCPTENQLIYPEFECKDMLSQDPLNAAYANNPILKKLPIVESFYNENGDFIYYKINFKTKIDEETNQVSGISLIITDYTGNSKDIAMKKIQENSSSTDTYEIIYNDESNFSQAPAKAPDN